MTDVGKRDLKLQQMKLVLENLILLAQSLTGTLVSHLNKIPTNKQINTEQTKSRILSQTPP